jgi:TctA family transporter
LFDVILQALGNIVDPQHLIWLVLGVAIGWWTGIIPGIGSIVGIAVMLPFLYGMDPTSGIFLLIGIYAVNNTSDSFPAVLFGIPGGSSSVATIMDGYPLSKKGQAGRALGAAFTASMLGGILGSIVLLAVLPIARPLVLSLGSPELLMVTFLGLILVGIISRGAVLMGVLGATVGLALSAVGIAPAVYQERYTFDTIFLQDGLSVVVVALGLFGIPELLHLVTTKQAVARPSDGRGIASLTSAGLTRGGKDVFRNFPLVLGSSWMASVVAIIPGIGGSIVTWVAWTIAGLSKKKNKVPLGQGEIRGVIAPEAANNATDGGHLVPTLLFGIPASGGMALLLAGMTLMGVQGGPQLLKPEGPNGLVLIVSIVLALVLANVMGTAICFFIARWVARLSFVPGRVIAPFLVVVLTLAVFQENDQIGFLFITLGVGAVGWIFVRLGIPRVPVLVGFVLGSSIERYLWISMSRFGTDWLALPQVWVIFALAVLLAVGSVALNRRASRSAASQMKWR